MLGQINSEVPSISKTFRFLFGSILTESRIQQDSQQEPRTCLNACICLLYSLPPIDQMSQLLPSFVSLTYSVSTFPVTPLWLCLEGKSGAGADSEASTVSLTQAEMHTPLVMWGRWQSQQVKIAGDGKTSKVGSVQLFFFHSSFPFYYYLSFLPIFFSSYPKTQWFYSEVTEHNILSLQADIFQFYLEI